MFTIFVSCSDNAGSHFRFDAKSPAKAMEWVEAIRQAINDEQEREKLRVSGTLLVCVHMKCCYDHNIVCLSPL